MVAGNRETTLDRGPLASRAREGEKVEGERIVSGLVVVLAVEMCQDERIGPGGLDEGRADELTEDGEMADRSRTSQSGPSGGRGRAGVRGRAQSRD
jgi:hypothetical protein